MSDIQRKIAARRAELIENELADKHQEAANQAALKVARQDQLKAVMDEISEDISTESILVKRENEELVIIDSRLPELDVDGLKQSKIDRLLKREARKRWTPGENWLIICCIVGGVILLPFKGFGVIPLLFGLLHRATLNKKYRAAVRDDYPHIFPPS